MLYGNESISQYTRGNVFIWMAMAFQAGVLNVGGFMACHRFVSHVTGFAAYFGYEVSEAKLGPALSMLTVPLFFLFGAMLSGQLVDLRLKLHKNPRYYFTFGVIFFLTLVVFLGGIFNFFGTFGEVQYLPRNNTLLALLCFICGIQNGTITTVSKSVVRTTHLTGITTDLGIGIMRILSKNKLKGEIPDEGKANLMRIGIIFFFGVGSLVGAFAFHHFQYGGFILPVVTSGFLFILMLYFHKFGKRQIPIKI